MDYKINIIKSVLLGAVFFFAAGFIKEAEAQETILKSQEINSRLDAYLSPYFEQKDFSGVALILQGNKILAHKEYGLANLKMKSKNRLNTKFRVASLSKAFTGASIVMLRDQGKLKLDDPLSKFFPNFPNGQNITIDQLLRHRSGVGELDEPKHFQNCFSANQLVEEVAKVKPLFPPNTDNSYSNEGYYLLAAIIEKVSGQTYNNFLQKNIFEPLKMKDSGSFCRETKLSNMASGYMTGGIAKSVEELPFSELTQIGAGSVYSTAEDLLKWLKAVDEKRLFQIDKLTYPYGWGVREYAGKKLIEQSGLVEGFNSYMALYSKEKVYMIFLSNIQSGLFNRVPRDFNAVVFGGEFSKPSPLIAKKISKDKLKEYLGEYKQDGAEVPLRIIQQNGKLYLRWGNYPFKRSLTFIDGDKFYHRAEYSELTFERNSEGQIEKIKWQPSGGDAFYLNRIESK